MCLIGKHRTSLFSTFLGNEKELVTKSNFSEPAKWSERLIPEQSGWVALLFKFEPRTSATTPRAIKSGHYRHFWYNLLINSWTKKRKSHTDKKVLLWRQVKEVCQSSRPNLVSGEHRKLWKQTQRNGQLFVHHCAEDPVSATEQLWFYFYIYPFRDWFFTGFLPVDVFEIELSGKTKKLPLSIVLFLAQ